MSHRKTISILAVLLTAAATSVATQAGEGKEHGRHDRLAQADKDGDGKISREEAAAMPRMAKNFDKLDANKDGFISKDEMKAAHEAHRGERGARPDTDRDGNISKAEAERFPKLKENFSKIDTNGDGVLSKEEMKAAHDKKPKH